MLSLVVAAACLIGSVFAQLPSSYTLASTNTTLGVRYGSVDVVPGRTLGYNVPANAPTLISSLALKSTYIAIVVDTTANLSAPIPADLLWFQQDVTFSPTGIAIANTTAQVPYLAPSNVGHAYLVLLYTQPPNFIIPPNFPYSATFRKGFNVTRVGVDFKSPLLEANWFVLGSNCTKVVGSGVSPSGSGDVLPSGTGSVLPSGTGGIVRSMTGGIFPSPTGVIPTGTRGVFPSGTGSIISSRTGGVFPTASTGHHGKTGPNERSSGLRLRG